jgi:hypothetical protein
VVSKLLLNTNYEILGAINAIRNMLETAGHPAKKMLSTIHTSTGRSLKRRNPTLLIRELKKLLHG